ncbi:hypothetical protein [Methylobacterium nigriterrae]|uniref:hypothetical protein n=1 Tax=Methylobacterium nigriterrae TaxID=3127512 RepID=UPI003D6793A8
MDDRRTRRRARVTLDSQLVSYWDREAARLDALAEAARFGWMARRYRRKAVQARAQAERSRAREAARGGTSEPAPAAAASAATADPPTVPIGRPPDATDATGA